MKIIQDECLIKEFDSGLISQYLGGMSLGVFDIETLGLNPQYCPIVLAGFLEPGAGGACRITQYFAEVPEDVFRYMSVYRITSAVLTIY